MQVTYSWIDAITEKYPSPIHTIIIVLANTDFSDQPKKNLIKAFLFGVKEKLHLQNDLTLFCNVFEADVLVKKKETC